MTLWLRRTQGLDSETMREIADAAEKLLGYRPRAYDPPERDDQP